MRNPTTLLVVALIPIALAIWGCWESYPYRLRSVAEALGFALFLSAPALLIAIGAAVTRIRTRNASLPWPVLTILLVLLLVNLLWILGAFMAMG